MKVFLLSVSGCELAATLSGALYWQERRTLVVADLHLEKGTAFARLGILLPPYDTRSTLHALEHLALHFRPDRIVCLGDSFHDHRGALRLAEEDAQQLRRLIAGCDWVWVSGNHDATTAGTLGGRTVGIWESGPLVFRHQADGDGEPGEVSGHYHPKASLWMRQRRLTVRCFVGDGRRLIMPAFGAYTGGLDISSPIIAGLMRPDFTAHLLGRRGIYPVKGARLSRAVAR
ncbi:MAG: ligase-associated DNA damage response endonuclease PdeM [Rhodospirillales bacterium]